jgi:F-type H+-transporting ATPase subunit delta
MSNRASALRYARALFDVVLKESDPDQAEHDLADFTTLFEQHDDLHRALVNPAVPVTAKKTVVTQLIDRVTLRGPVAKLLGLLAERDRLELLPEILTAYRERLMEHHHVVHAEIVTAMPIDDDRLAALQRQLAGATGRTVTMTTRVDPSLVGGVVAKIGTTVYDGSVATQLAKMRERLADRV